MDRHLKWRIHWPKNCDNENKDEIISLAENTKKQVQWIKKSKNVAKVVSRLGE